MLWRSGYGFCAAPRISCGENRERHAVRERVYGCPQKRNRIGALRWRTLRSRIRFNPERIRWAVQWMVRRMNVLWAVNANWNDDGWNVEANSVSNPNEWNAGNEFLSRYPFLSPPTSLLGGFFASNPLRHPPIMRPAPSMRVANSSKCLLCINLASHAI